MALADRLEKEILKRITFAEGIDTGRRALAQTAAANLYALLGKPAPAVVWCQSPYQLATLPSLLIGIFFSDAWQIASGMLSEREYDEIWEADFDEAWCQLWQHGGQQLLKGMRSTSRIGSQYQQLEEELLLQCKNELARWIRSGKLAAFEDTLPKQIIYRQFWAMRLWHLNFVQDRLRILSADLLDGLSARNNYWQDWEAQWQQFLPYSLLLERIYAGAQSALDSLMTRMGAEPRHQVKHCTWLPFTLLPLSVCQVWRTYVDPDAFKNYAAEIDAWTRLAESSLGVICLEHVVFACEKPQTLLLDEGGRFHSETGPALVFSDGFTEYAWHGILVDGSVIMEPEKISIEEIETSQNIESRRVLIERFGQARYLQESGAEEVQSDDFGTLYRKEIPGDEALVMVKVLNSSPEPDGSFKDYFLRVPPEMTTAQQAVAWTFGIDEEEYKPLIES